VYDKAQSTSIVKRYDLLAHANAGHLLGILQSKARKSCNKAEKFRRS
jgi:hypothetical protein